MIFLGVMCTSSDLKPWQKLLQIIKTCGHTHMYITVHNFLYNYCLNKMDYGIMYEYFFDFYKYNLELLNTARYGV